jgi:hypothetical protein
MTRPLPGGKEQTWDHGGRTLGLEMADWSHSEGTTLAYPAVFRRGVIRRNVLHKEMSAPAPWTQIGDQHGRRLVIGPDVPIRIRHIT